MVTSFKRPHENRRKIQAASVVTGFVLAAICGTHQARAATLQVDLANDVGDTGTDPGTGLWNNLDNRSSPSSAVALNYADGTISGASAQVTNTFFYHYNNGHVLAGYPDSAAKDGFESYLYKNTNDAANGPWTGGDGYGEITFSGLNPGTQYDFLLYGSSNDGSYSTTATYTLTGSNVVSADYKSFSNNAATLLMTGVTPDSNGKIVLGVAAPTVAEDVAAGTTAGAAGLNFIQITAAAAVPEPASLVLLGLGALGLIQRRRNR